jgi:acetyl coenzyme A synthetase (ADP forming)-like protein
MKKAQHYSTLDAVLKPRSVAVVGASNRPGSVGGEIFRNLIGSSFTGAVYPVNRSSKVVQSVRAYPSLAEVPDEVELVIVAVPRDSVPAVVEDSAAKGARGMVIITAGFSETGAEGAAIQDRILDQTRGNGIRLVGPNCLGVLNTDPEIRLNATFAPTWPQAGNIAFLSQSGALGVAILDYAHSLGIGISQFVSVGNKADVSGNDLLEYWEADPGTEVILLYLESFGDPRRFMTLARRIGRTKPIIAVKSGRTESGARAASSHTGSLAGLDVAVDALLGQAGVIRVDTIEELFDAAMLLANQPVPRGNQVAILTNAGGPGIMASDACESRGLEIPRLSPQVEEGLRTFLPAEASVRNPVDMLAAADAPEYERSLALLLDDDRIDAVIVLFVPPIFADASAVAEAILTAAEGTDKPVLTCLMGTHGVPAALSSLRKGHFPSYAFPEDAALALVRAVRYGEWLARGEQELPSPIVDAAEQARAAIRPRDAVDEGGSWLDPDEVAGVLAAYGIRTPESVTARNAKAAAKAAKKIGYPVVLKLASDTITHKTDVGGVVANLEDASAVRHAFETVRSGLAAAGREGEMKGVLVQQMVQGVELFVGSSQDPKFGALIAFGVGGINVELWRDVVFRVHPITAADARDMLDDIRGAKLLDGFRGSQPVDRDAVVDTLVRLSLLVGDLPEILEIDINPLMALPPGEGVVAVDARVRIGGGG